MRLAASKNIDSQIDQGIRSFTADEFGQLGQGRRNPEKYTLRPIGFGAFL
jgi:hypothetical protein